MTFKFPGLTASGYNEFKWCRNRLQCTVNSLLQHCNKQNSKWNNGHQKYNIQTVTNATGKTDLKFTETKQRQHMPDSYNAAVSYGKGMVWKWSNKCHQMIIY